MNPKGGKMTPEKEQIKVGQRARELFLSGFNCTEAVLVDSKLVDAKKKAPGGA